MKNRLFLSFTALLLTASLGAQLHVTGLRVEHMKDPSVVDNPRPRLSWINEVKKASLRGQRQTAYEVVVSSSRENLDRGIYDVWQTGRRESAESNLITYEGPALQDAADYFWKVRTWNQDGKVSAWSQTGHWGMGLAQDKWTARWIVGPRDGMEGIFFRKSFTPEKEVRQAKVFVCGLGFFELYLNGQRVGDDYLVPNISNYGRRTELKNFAISIEDNFRGYRCLYMAYDITQQLLQGQNMLGVMLGAGWFNPDRSNACRFGQPCLRLQLMLTFADGSTAVIPTDGTWQTRLSPITYGGIYGGETYDARQEVPGWDMPGSSNEGWETARTVKGPSGEMTAMTSPADKITECLSPVSLKKVGERKYEVDFGREISGWIHFRGLNGIEGDTLCADFVCESPQGAERYVFSGKAGEEYRPHFTWYVFSRAFISGIDTLTADQLVAEAVNTDVPVMAEFHTSNPLFNRINQIWQYSQTDNMHGCIASDCPHRERLPYTGDGEAAAETVMHNFDAAAFYQKWIRDMRDAQNRETGHEPNSAPWQPGAGGGVAWGAALTLIPWWYYVQYADRKLLEDTYPNMKDQVRYMLSWVTLDGIMHQQMRNYGRGDLCYWLNLGDWVPPRDMPRDALVHTFYLWQCCDYCARAARVLGNEEEARYYQGLTDKVWANFHRYFYNAEEKSYGLGGSNIYALRMGVPKERHASVVATLRREIMEDNKGCINTGFLATKYFFETLSDNGLHDVAYTVMNQRKQPSYGWWVDQGATVTWECWDGANSHNHPMFGSGLTWYYRYLAGVRADELQPGYRHVILRPFLSELEEVHYACRTPYGRLLSEIRQTGDKHTMTVSIPVGSTATLYLPTAGPVSEGGRPLEKSKGVTLCSQTGAETVLELEQGTYSFTF